MEYIIVLIFIGIVTLYNKDEEKPKSSSLNVKNSRSKKSELDITTATRNSWEKSKIAILERYNYCCAICSSTQEIHVHHIIPRKDGGTNDLENLIPLCRICHEELHHYKFKEDNLKSFNDKYGTRAKKNTTQKKGYIILSAIRNKRKLQIKYKKRDYQNGSYEYSTRLIQPLNIKLANDIKDNEYIIKSNYAKEHHIVYVEAYCFLRKAKRLFRLKNIEILDIL